MLAKDLAEKEGRHGGAGFLNQLRFGYGSKVCDVGEDVECGHKAHSRKCALLECLLGLVDFAQDLKAPLAIEY